MKQSPVMTLEQKLLRDMKFFSYINKQLDLHHVQNCTHHCPFHI